MTLRWWRLCGAAAFAGLSMGHAPCDTLLGRNTIVWNEQKVQRCTPTHTHTHTYPPTTNHHHQLTLSVSPPVPSSQASLTT